MVLLGEAEKPERVIELAGALLAEGQAEAAVTLLRPWVEANPDSADGQKLLGAAYSELGRWTEADVPTGQRVLSVVPVAEGEEWELQR